MVSLPPQRLLSSSSPTRNLPPQICHRLQTYTRTFVEFYRSTETTGEFPINSPQPDKSITCKSGACVISGRNRTSASPEGRKDRRRELSRAPPGWPFDKYGNRLNNWAVVDSLRHPPPETSRSHPPGHLVYCLPKRFHSCHDFTW